MVHRKEPQTYPDAIRGERRRRDLAGEAAALLREAMSEEGISSSELARRLGKSKGEVSQLLNGKRNVTLRTLDEIASALGREVDVRLTTAPSRTRASTELEPLVRAAARGDDQAWTRLVVQYTPLIRRVASAHRLQPADIDDVVDATWVALLRNIGRISEPAALPAWLTTMARRESLRLLQRSSVRDVLSDDVGELIDAVASEPARDDIAADINLDEALSGLPERQRRLMKLLLTESDPSYEEISRQLDMPIGSIGPTRARALDRLRRDPKLAELADLVAPER